MKFFACIEDTKDTKDTNTNWICINDNLSRMVVHSTYYCNYGIFLYDLVSNTKYKRVWDLNVKVNLMLDENGIYLYDYSYIPLPLNSSQFEYQGFIEIPKKFLEQYEIDFLNNS